VDPPSLFMTIGSAFLSKLEPETLFAVALIIIWWVYRETIWSKLKP
jgi:hypothetical protein